MRGELTRSRISRRALMRLGLCRGPLRRSGREHRAPVCRPCLAERVSAEASDAHPTGDESVVSGEKAKRIANLYPDGPGQLTRDSLRTAAPRRTRYFNDTLPRRTRLWPRRSFQGLRALDQILQAGTKRPWSVYATYCRYSAATHSRNRRPIFHGLRSSESAQD